ncbi:c-type cytochrome [Helicobacter sp. 11S02629-2]|uniref:c-type cytochrome n=1 Tax=Helicobacter sp. 11S02629-2 TaxID=1476195 RepID=UPI000BA572EB|nr:c-type cytochrome [Helicobacter sp. 11S02629-2]PAF45849.1 cytochrome C oxidase Cbb3 [Helicobacter sp. 11S02629-2]
MKLKTLVLTFSILACSGAYALTPSVVKEKQATGINLPAAEWKVPDAINKDDGSIDASKLPKSPYTEAVILGSKIMNETHNFIGPDAKDKSKRFAGNHLSCSSCHALGGTVAGQSGFVGILGRFPAWQARSDKVTTLEDRINGCMVRSMNGKMVPVDSKEMKAMMAYMHFLSQGIPVGAKVKGQGLPKIGNLDRAADPKKGKIVYDNSCSACHGINGEGIKNVASAKGDYYTFPPLWGKDSYNTGAGMYRLKKCAAYVKANMPQGNATLTLEESYDVCAFINTQPRPIFAHREKDFPDLRVKPLDMDVGSYDDKFDVKQHRFGPYDEMVKH